MGGFNTMGLSGTTKSQLKREIQTLDLAIADAVRRMESNPTDAGYVKAQQERIDEWEAQKKQLQSLLDK